MGCQFGCSRTTRKVGWVTLRDNQWRYTQAFGKPMTGPRKAVAWSVTGTTHHSAPPTGTSTTKAHAAGRRTWHGCLATQMRTRGSGQLSMTTRRDSWSGSKMNSWSTTIVPIIRGSLRLRLTPRSVIFKILLRDFSSASFFIYFPFVLFHSSDVTLNYFLFSSCGVSKIRQYTYT